MLNATIAQVEGSGTCTAIKYGVFKSEAKIDPFPLESIFSIVPVC